MSHAEDSTALLERVLAHPALAGVTEELEGSVSGVGGVVRDAMLERAPGPDVDLVVEGDPGPLARRLAERLDAELTEHPEFRTASVRRLDGHLIDLVGARTERYPEPGALPEVAPGSLADDLVRRDFTINAMAVRLGGVGAGTLVDPADGRADLAAGQIRTLRSASFEEDPSRLVRAARYGARLGFVLEPATATAAARAAPALDISSARVLGELARLLEESAAAEGLARLSDLGVGWLRPRAELVPAISVVDRASERLGASPRPAWALRLAVATAEDLGSRLPGPAANAVRAARAGAARGMLLGPRAKLSEVDAALDGLGALGAVSALAVGCEPVVAWWEATKARVLSIDGDDLVSAGVVPGPGIGLGLARARAAALDGVAPDRAAQLRIALEAAIGEAEPS